MEIEDDTVGEFLLLLKCLGDCGETIEVADSDASGRAADIRGLVLKALYHGSSILYLYRRTKVTELKIDFTDFASIQVIARALLETALTFNYVFKQSNTDGEIRLRHAVWQLSGMRHRHRSSTQTSIAKQKFQDELSFVKKLENDVRSHPLISGLPPKTANRWLSSNDWRIPAKNKTGEYKSPSWEKLAQQAGISEQVASNTYTFLSGYTHTSYTAVFQIHQGTSEKDRRELCDGTFDGAKISLALLIRDLSLLFLEVSNLLDERDPERRIVKKWLEVAAYAGSDEAKEPQSGIEPLTC